MFWTVVITFINLFAALPLVIAQTTGARCMASFDWASNSLKQSPCAVASFLLGTCDVGIHDIPALPEGSHYVGPTTTTANPCECNTVVYSLISACGECQNRTIAGWGSWSANCPHVDIGTFPNEIPSGTRVPGWAYLDVKANDQFDVDMAKANVNDTESVAPQPIQTSSTSSPRSSLDSLPHTTTHMLTSSIPSSASSVTPTPMSNSSVSSNSSSSNVMVRDTWIDKIIGGVIGGVVALALLSGLALYLYRRRRRRRDIGQMLESPTMSQEHTNALPYVSMASPAASPHIVVHSDDIQYQTDMTT